MERSKTYHLALMGVLTALLFMGQVIMAVLPNIEIISLLIILYTIFFGRKVFWMIYCFVFLEGFLYGFGMWFFNYLYVWTALALVCLPLRKNRSALFWSIISGFFGLFFGTLCTLPYLLTGGPAAAFWAGRRSDSRKGRSGLRNIRAAVCNRCADGNRSPR